MLVALSAETASVISRVLNLTAFVCCALVLLSFALFARDQIAGASTHQQTELVAGANSTPAGGAPSKPHAQPRRFVDGVAKVLTSPFDAVVQSGNDWAKHGLPAVLAVLVYGVGFGYLARYTSVRG